MNARLRLIHRLLLVGLGALTLRLGVLQLLQGRAYRQLAEQNRLRVVPQAAPRGLIVDRLGRRLVTNQIAFRVAVVPQDTKETPQLFARLSQLTGRSTQQLQRAFAQSRSLPFLPAAVVSYTTKPVALCVEEERASLPGVLVETVMTRHYPLGTVAAPLLGYVSQPTEEAFPLLKPYGVRPQDLVGRAGLEWALDAYLRGRPGGSVIEVDHRARQRRVVGARAVVPGDSVVLTIDARLQALIEEQFGAQSGACVVLRPQTGEVLAMASLPTFAPEAFAAQDQDALRAILNDPSSPLLNRAVNGAYLPGSIVKPLLALTALEARLLDPAAPVTCHGYLTIGDRRFHCWNRDGHGPLTLREGLMQSCNVYFMRLGLRLGFPRLRAAYAHIGFGARTGWLLDEHPGHLPSAWRVGDGDLALLSIGQGELLITPLQAAVMASALANHGSLVQPWVVFAVGGHRVPPRPPHPLGWSARNVSVVLAAMEAVIREPHATGHRASSDLVRIAGKTGTAQTHLPGRTHGWFIGFCPADAPLVAMAIVAEYGGTGGELPASIGKIICEYIVSSPPQEPIIPDGAMHEMVMAPWAGTSG